MITSKLISNKESWVYE